MKKIAIVGVKGHVGSALMELLNLKSYELLPTDKDEVDVTDRDEVRLFMQRNRPDVVINCAGITDPQQCEDDPDEAYRVNALGGAEHRCRGGTGQLQGHPVLHRRRV
ncbi:MAG: sugar nucleotide-binding protein [Clostridiales bacterium]|nr:sugar nucleotide-binding protein [Clostridiales bacterium]